VTREEEGGGVLRKKLRVREGNVLRIAKSEEICQRDGQRMIHNDEDDDEAVEWVL
jgi:hypothetical protein